VPDNGKSSFYADIDDMKSSGTAARYRDAVARRIDLYGFGIDEED